MKHAPFATRRSARRGFTLVELMIAMLAGSITVSAGYYLSTMSARTIGDQMRASDTQMSLRVAMDQVRRDFSRAAYFGSRNSATLPAFACGIATSSLGPLTTGRVRIDGSAAAFTANILNPGTTATTNRTRADLVTLDGSFASSSMFLVDNTVVQAGNVVGLDPTRPSFLMAFAPPTSCNGGADLGQVATRFNAVFFPGRVLRFENGGNFWFRRITARDGTAAVPTITLDADLPDVGCADRGKSYVAVVSRIEYRVDPIVAFPATAPDDLVNMTIPGAVQQAVGSQTRAVLVRREIDYTTGLPMVPSTASIVLDNVVEFQVNGIYNTAAAGAVPVFAVADSATVPTIETVSTGTPQQLRSLVVTLSARSMEGDRVRAHLPRASLDDPMLTFQMGAGPAAANFFVARVKTMRSEVFLPNTVN